MKRLTRWNDKTESAELTAYDDYDWEQFWNKEVLDIVDSLRLQPAFDMLAEYEDLEEQLESVYGEHSGLLETMVKSLVRHEGADFGKPYKARLLTDEDVDKWEEYKDLEEQGRLIKLPCKVGDEFYIIAYRDEKVNNVKCTGYMIQNDEVNKINDSYVWLDSIDKPYDFWKLQFNEFDNQCFLTKKEAEKALEMEK